MAGIYGPGGQDVTVKIDEADFGRLTRGVAAFDKELGKALGKRLGTIGKPLGQAVIRSAAADMPHRGGLSDRIAKTRLTVSVTKSVRSGGVRLRLRSLDGYDLRKMDAGTLRRPVFADARKPRSTWSWVHQSIRPGAFSRAFDAGKPDAAHAAEQALLDALASIPAGEAHIR